MEKKRWSKNVKNTILAAVFLSFGCLPLSAQGNSSQSVVGIEITAMGVDVGTSNEATVGVTITNFSEFKMQLVEMEIQIQVEAFLCVVTTTRDCISEGRIRLDTTLPAGVIDDLSFLTLTNLPSGDYEFVIRATVLGLRGNQNFVRWGFLRGTITDP